MIIFILGKNTPKHKWSQFPKCETKRKQSSEYEEATALRDVAEIFLIKLAC